MRRGLVLAAARFANRCLGTRMGNRWLHLDYVGKGVCLGLLALMAVSAADARSAGVFFLATVLGLLVLLGLTALRKVKEGYRLQGRLPAFLLFLFLEHPVRVYAGVLGGMALGVLVLVLLGWLDWWRPALALAGGVAAGVVFWLLRHVRHRYLRSGAVLILGAGVLAGIVFWLTGSGTIEESRRALFGVHVLLAIPLLYLLTLSGRAEETELEIGAMCVALGVGLWFLLPDTARLLAVLAPFVLYLAYTNLILRRLRVFKHVLRGLSYNELGRHREALLAYRRALALAPGNRAAQEGLWRVHKRMDFSKVVHEPETMALIDLDLCLKRATDLLLRSGVNAERLEEAHKLLTLVLDQRPAMQPAVYYWRAVAHVHARDFDQAAVGLRTVLDAANYAPDDPYRDSVLLAAWQLALTQHGEMKRRVGLRLLQEGKRLEAIAAVERQLADTPSDAGAWELKRLLYDGLTEAEFLAAIGNRPSAIGQSPDAAAAGSRQPIAERRPPIADFDYCLQLGQALIADAGRWRSGAEYLRIAAWGLRAKGPGLYYQIAQASEQAGDTEGARYAFEMVKLLAREIGLKNLGPEEKRAYFATVKQLGETACTAGDLDRAIENLALYVESEQSGVDTLRLLTELYEKKGDVLAALHVNERALMYDARNKLFLERKESYYYSVTPEDLRARLEQVHKTFDVGYCVRKAKSLLDVKDAGVDLIDWAAHLADLARVVQPDGIAPLVLAARARLRKDEQSEAIGLLEEARGVKPDKFASADDEEAWYAACRLLGDLYLQTLGKPDQALACYSDYRKHSKSGADTLFKMGLCYEQLGDRIKAAKCYQNVTIYDHPLAWDASQALQRLAAEG